MIKAKDEWNEWRENNKMLRIEGADDFINFLAKQHRISLPGLRKILKEWKEQLE